MVTGRAPQAADGSDGIGRAGVPEWPAPLLHTTGTLMERMHIELEDVGPDGVSARMPVQGNTQPYGLLHGGASAVLAETVGSVAAALHAGSGRIALGVELNCTHHRAARDGYVRAVATPIHLGGTLATFAIAITAQDGSPVCTARLTCLLRERPPSGADPSAARQGGGVGSQL